MKHWRQFTQDCHLRQLQRGQAGPQDARQEEDCQEWRDQLVIMLSLVNKINYIYRPVNSTTYVKCLPIPTQKTNEKVWVEQVILIN